MEIAKTNRTDLYLLDAKKSLKVDEWLKTVAGGADSLKSFIDTFPDDILVQQYKKKNTPDNLEELQIHISAVSSRIPLRMYFDAHGLTDHYLMRKLKEKVDSTDDDVSLKALKLALKTKNPDERPTPLRAKQNNFFINSEGKNKKEIIDRILSNVAGDYKVVND